MNQESPRVSIGMPVYNGEDYLADALESLLSQTFEEMEIIISDNGSTDATEDICNSFAARDGRIRCHRSDVNQGAAWNYNRVFELATGEYFKWAAHDDICAPELVERCVDVLDSQPDVVLCYSQTRAIDSEGKTVRDYPVKPGAAADRAHERFHEFVCVPHPCVSVFGLARRDVLAKTKLIGKYSSSDRPLLGELALRGRLYELPEILFFYRVHEEQSWGGGSTRQQQQSWYDPRRAGKITLPHWRLLGEHIHTINRVPLGMDERLYCYGCMVKWSRRRWRYLTGNLLLREKI